MGLLKSIGKLDLEITVGAGQPGLKTLGLRRDKKDIRESGFHYPINAALTPAFLQRRLMDANIQPSDDYNSASEKLKRVPFTGSEKAEIMHALHELPPKARTRLIIRSDESAEGTGLMASRHIFQEESAGMDALVTAVETAVAEVMASECGNNKLNLYKRIMGIEGNAGILIMPVYGESFVVSNSGQERKMIYPVFGLNYLGPYNRKSLLHIFANEYILGSEQLAIENPDGARREVGPSVLVNKLRPINGLPPYPRYRRSLIERVARLIRKVGSRYLEVVKDSWDKPEFVVVQSAPFSCPQIEKPGKKEWKTDVKTSLAFGISHANIHECRHVDLTFRMKGWKEEVEAFNEYDAMHKGYLLIEEGDTAGMLVDRLYGKLNLVNAGAILVYDTKLNTRMAFSHLGGFARALGIPILITDKPPSFMAALREKKEMNLECAVYSNQFDGEGILALRKN